MRGILNVVGSRQRRRPRVVFHDTSKKLTCSSASVSTRSPVEVAHSKRFASCRTCTESFTPSAIADRSYWSKKSCIVGGCIGSLPSLCPSLPSRDYVEGLISLPYASPPLTRLKVCGGQSLPRWLEVCRKGTCGAPLTYRRPQREIVLQSYARYEVANGRGSPCLVCIFKQQNLLCQRKNVAYQLLSTI